MKARVTIYEDQEPTEVRSLEELDDAIDGAADFAQSQGRPNIIFVVTANGNSLSLVVGANDTVLCFNYGHQDPPYYVSLGEVKTDEPVLTAYVTMNHHTEFLRRNVVSLESGRNAAREFLESSDLPGRITWEEL